MMTSWLLLPTNQSRLPTKKQCFSISANSNSIIHGPKFKASNISRLAPIANMVIESNAENLDQDTLKLLESNQESQRMLHSLSKYGFQLSMIRECLELVNHEEILGKVWNYGLENCATIRQQRFHRLVQHVLTWFFSRCSRIIPIKTNHERAYFVDFVVPIFQFFHDQIRHFDFQWYRFFPKAYYWMVFCNWITIFFFTGVKYIFKVATLDWWTCRPGQRKEFAMLMV